MYIDRLSGILYKNLENLKNSYKTILYNNYFIYSIVFLSWQEILILDN